MKIVRVFFLIHFAAAYPSWFHDYIQEHSKKYTLSEAARAFDILRPKYAHILSHSGLDLKLHGFSDQKRHKRRLDYTKSVRQIPSETLRLGLPLSFDWREKGHVTDPLAQGVCAGCYAFAAVTSLEHWFKKKSGVLMRLSTQEALDCSKNSDGCEGGLMEDVFKSSMHHPISLAAFHRLRRKDLTCPRVHHPHIRVQSFAAMTDDWNSNIESSLARNIVRYGPVTVGIDSQSLNFELYQGGILNASHCGKSIDHGVAIVGFTPEYWIIKNSWGTRWGEHGYLRLRRGQNACGIGTYASYVTDASL